MRAAFDAVEHPFQDAHVFAVTGPEKFSIFISAEPVHMENLGRVLNLPSHLEPMPEIIAHVVTAERKHGHGIATGDAYSAGSSSSGFRGQRGADKYAVLPV